MNEKYFAAMGNASGKKVFAQSWSLQALNEWIEYHERKGYVITKRG